jgi:PilZ domain
MSEPVQPPENRRRCRRQKPKGSTKILTLKGSLGLGRTVALSILDLSETGVRLIVKENLEKNQEVEVNLESPTCRRPIKTLGNVVWSVAVTDGTHCVGVVFRRPLPYADFSQFTVV